jgi:hypothetical protein
MIGEVEVVAADREVDLCARCASRVLLQHQRLALLPLASE